MIGTNPVNVVNVTPQVVECDWCQGGKLTMLPPPAVEREWDRWDHRCLMCATTRDRWEADEVTDWRAWERWLDLIADNPGNDLLRLALADWLEENTSWIEQAQIERAKVTMEVPS